MLQKPTSSNVKFVHPLSCIGGMLKLRNTTNNAPVYSTLKLMQYNQQCTTVQHVSSRIINYNLVSIGLVPSWG